MNAYLYTSGSNKATAQNQNKMREQLLELEQQEKAAKSALSLSLKTGATDWEQKSKTHQHLMGLKKRLAKRHGLELDRHGMLK